MDNFDNILSATISVRLPEITHDVNDPSKYNRYTKSRSRIQKQNQKHNRCKTNSFIG